jgi:hypothetical protein
LGWPNEEPNDASPPFATHYADAKPRLLFVTPGRYDVLLFVRDEDGARNVGLVTVTAGRKTKFSPNLPTGGLRVRINGTGVAPGLSTLRLVRRDSTDAPATIQRRPTYAVDSDKQPKFPLAAHFHYVPPGLWAIRYSPHGFDTIDQEVVIDDRTVEHSVALTRR